MSLNDQLQLRGRIIEGKHGLCLRVDGGQWVLGTSSELRRLIGQDVIVSGNRCGFNELECTSVWPVGETRPVRSSFSLEPVIAGAMVLSGYAGMLGWLVKVVL